MQSKNDLSYDSVASLLRYDEATGAFTWKERPRSMFDSDRICNAWNAKHAEKPAGCEKERYTFIRIGRRTYLAHRLAWLLHYREWPEDEIDHINANKRDNRISNLRAADSSQNKHNIAKGRKNSTGFKGVWFSKWAGRYVAHICFRNKRKHLGYFNDPQDAHAAYCAAAKKYHGEFARTT